MLRGGRYVQEWLLIGSVLFALGLFLAWDRFSEYRDTEREQGPLLAAQALAVDQNLSKQIEGAAAALRGVRDDLVNWPPDQIGLLASRRLKALSDAMPGVDTMLLVDRNGLALASNQPEFRGRDFSQWDYFRQARERPDPGLLVLSQPFVNTLGVLSMSLTIAVTGADGSFQGVISAILDPAYFKTVLRSTLYAEDMWAAVGHGDGQVLMIEPPVAGVAGMNVDRPGSFFRRHRELGQTESVMSGTVAATGERRMMAVRTVRLPELSMDKPLVIAVSRRLDAVFEPWFRNTTAHAVLYALFAVATALGLHTIQQRQRAIDRLEAQREAENQRTARRLELALRGADLGLWDLDIPSGTSTVNERWSTMLGLPHDPSNAGGLRWRAHVHPDDWERVSSAQQAHIDGASPHFEEVYRMRHHDGRWLWIADRGRVLERAADGSPLRMVGTHMDITERMRSQRALEDSEESLSITLQSIGDAVVATDPAGRVTRINATAERLTGWVASEAVGRPLGEVFRIFNARSREPAVDPVQQVLARGEVIGLANDTLLIARDGHEYQIADSAAPIRTRSGEIAGVVLVFSDVTERYRVEQALRDNERRLRSLLDNLSAGVIVHGADTHITDANPAACRVTGLSLDQMRGKVSIDPYWAFLEEDGAPMPHERFPVPQVLASGEPLKNFVLGVRRTDLPRPVWVLCNAYPLRDAEGAIEQIFVTFVDITERKEADEELRLLGASVEHLNDVVMITEASELDAPGPRMVFVNGAFERLTGWKREEAIGLSPRILQGPRTDPAELARIREALRRGEPVHAELINYTRAGSEYWVEFDIVPLRNRTGRVTHQVAIERDITERKRTEQQILATQGELEATLAAIPDLLFEMSLDGTYHRIHSPRHDVLYTTPDRFIGRKVADRLPADATEVIMKALEQANVHGFSTGLQYQLTVPKGPSWFELSVSRKPVPGGELPRFIMLVRDITERKHAEHERAALELQLREAQKMESIGTLAGGIAHDFNNILAAILGNVALAREDAAAGQPVLASLEQINRAGLRARNLVQQILAFSRRDQLAFSAQTLGPVVQETLALLRATLPANVRLEALLPPAPLTVRGNSTQLQQVLMNLCTNAWHALPEQGGRVEIGVERTSVLHPDVAEKAHGEWVHVWVRDNGRGMDDATRLRIFDPFFTTKPVGEGTGLGLSVVHGIVRAHEGAIAVDTAPGRGTTFHLYFPAHDDTSAESSLAPAGDVVARGAGQRVLYVDDDEVMVVLVDSLLQRAGFRVTVSTDATDALAQVRAQPGAFDLVVTDFNMPRLSGLEVARQIGQLRPDLPVVLSSGYISESLRGQALKAGVRALLQKENTFEELVDLVQRLLGPEPA